MSNRNFDCRIATQRRADRVIAQNIYSYQQNGLSPISNPLTSNASPQRVGQYSAGIQTTFYKGLIGGRYMGSIGGTANYILSTEELDAVTEAISSIPAGNNSTISIVAPSHPTNLSVEAGYESATVVFTEGFNGNSPIINYQYTIDGGITFQLFDPPQVSSPVTITGLTNGTTNYSIALKAVNSVGVSDNSEYVSTSPITVPSVPTDLSVTPGNGQVVVSFTEGFDGNSPITNYQYSTDNGNTFTAFNPTNIISPVTITGLTNGTTYQIQLKAMNAFGTSSASSTVIVRPSTIPSPPTGLIATPGNGQVTISFIPGFDNGSFITNYQYSINNGASFTAFSPEDANSPVTITGLTNGTTYQIKLKAVNANGASSASATVSSTPSGVPSPPTNLEAVAGNTSAYILFTAGNNGGSPITNYEYSTDGGETFTACNPEQTQSPIIIDGLSNNTLYNIVLKAVNAIGSSDPSTTVQVTTQGNTLNTSGLVVNLNAADNASYPGSGTTWTNLASGGSYSATLNNAPVFDSANPKALVFNGTDGYAQIANAAAIQPSVGGALTAQVWAKVNSVFTSGDGLISKQFGLGGGYDGYSLSLNTNGSIVLNMNGSSVNGNYGSAPGVFTADEWALYTIVVRFGGGSANPSYAYVSTRRVIDRANAESGINATAPLQIPRGIQETGSNFAPADIGAFYYYNRALTQQEIIQNFDATRERFSV